MKLARLLCIAVFACTLTSFHSGSSKNSTEDLSADIGLLSGPNQVQVHLYRGEPAEGCVSFKVDIWFNSESNVQTFTFYMGSSEYYKSETVQGPNPTGFAGISQQPYDIQSCY